MAKFGWAMVDVRYVGPGCCGQRSICAGPFTSFSQMAAILLAGLLSQTVWVPRRPLPDCLVRLSARFDPALRARVYELNKFRPV